MTREDINDIISAICPNDEDYEKPCISPKYLRQELEQLALDQRQWNGEPTTKNNLGFDCISRADVDAVIEQMRVKLKDGRMYILAEVVQDIIRELPPVTPQKPTCKECAYWKDSDGVYRRGVEAEKENLCPINTHTVYCGEGYCYMFSPKADMREEE